ncbi:hypothetical protein FG475_22085 [Vibrio navarrensis]|nr:hypothetical protein [Vibrio navarrensis]
MKSVIIKDSMTSLLMKSTSADKDTLHEQDQPLKKLAYVSNHRGPLLYQRSQSTLLRLSAKQNAMSV